MTLEDEPPATVDVRTERGGPRLFLNGEEAYPLVALSRDLSETLPNFKRGGIRFIQPMLGARECWTGPGEYDWSLFDDYLYSLLDQHPDAYFLPRLHLNTPTWWKEDHPEELVEYGLEYPDDRYDIVEKRSLGASEGGHYFGSGEELWAASAASESWRRDTAEMVRAYARHVEESPFAARIIGYHVATATTGEWHNYGPQHLPGYEPPMQERCESMPDPEARLETDHGLLRDPSTEKDVIEFYRTYHDAVSEAVRTMGDAVKDGSGGRALYGTFFNYLLENVWIQEAGHLSPRTVLEDPHVDFLASPYAYQGTNIGGNDDWKSDIVDGAGNWLGRARGVAGDGGYRVLTESTDRHDTLFIVELDPSTYRAPEPLLEGGSGSNTESGTIKLLRRDLGKAFASGNGAWLYDFGLHRGADVGWYSGEPIVETMGEFVDLGEQRRGLDVGSVARTAAVYSADSFFATQHWKATDGHTDFFNQWFLDSQSRTFHRIGAPFDTLYDFDLAGADRDRYDLLFMVNTFVMDEAAVDRIRDLLEGSGITVVWYYAPGYVSPDGLSIENMERLTGFQFEELTDPGTMMIGTSGDCRTETGIDRFGVDTEAWPRFGVTDHGATGLGTWVDRESTVAFARTELDGWESVYVGAAPLPAEVLRWLAREAGVQPWSDRPDVVEATEDAAMITATEAGNRTLSLHKPMRAVGTGEEAETHHLELDFGEVKLFTGS